MSRMITARSGAFAALLLAPALLATPAAADCKQFEGLESAGVVTEVKRTTLPGKSCVDGKVERLEPAAVMGKEVLRIPSGGYFVKDMKYQISAAHVEVSERAEKARPCREVAALQGGSNAGTGLGHARCGE